MQVLTSHMIRRATCGVLSTSPWLPIISLPAFLSPLSCLHMRMHVTERARTGKC